MEGLEITEISYSYVKQNNDVFRFDSDYFKKEFIAEESLIRSKTFKTLKDLEVELKSFGAYSLTNHVTYIESGIPFIRGINMKNGRIIFDDMVYIDKATNSLLWKSEVKPETVLLSMSGTVGDVALASKKWEYPVNSNQDIAKIDTKGMLNPYFLFAFLLSKFGQNYLNREKRGSVQQHVFLSQMELFEIPLFNSNFYARIEELVIQSDEKLLFAEKFYQQAETLLLETLGLKDFQPSTDPINIKSFKESFLATGRLDAEYYQRKYEDLTDKIKKHKHGYNKLEYYVDNYSTGFPFKSENYVEDGVPLIRITNINNGVLDITSAVKIPYDELYLSEINIAKENDILISMSGTIGNSCKIPSNIVAAVNQRIMRITPKNIDDKLLPLIINSIIGKNQLERIGTGGVQTNISANDILNILIPTLTDSQQQKIAELVDESFRLKNQSEQLLETAKRAVEIAIEKDENEALKFIESVNA